MTARETVRDELVSIVQNRELDVKLRFEAMDRLLALEPHEPRKPRVVVTVPGLKGEAKRIMETQPIKLLDLSVRTLNCLEVEWPGQGNVKELAMSHLCRMTERMVLLMGNGRSGRTVLNEIKTKLAAFGLALREETQP